MLTAGLDTALGEITLVLFTTLAPTGAFALMVIAAVLAFKSFKGQEEMRKQINVFFSIPLIVSMVGLIASATHLGNPANALYVFQGVGRSPLSNEVFFAVMFLFLAGVYWLYSFAAKPRLQLQRVWCVLIIIAGIFFIAFIGFAYTTDTIISWNTAYAPLALWLNAIVGGPLLALLTFRLAKTDVVILKVGKLFCILSGTAFIANTIVYILQSIGLADISNSFGSATELVPGYNFMIATFFVCNLAAILLYVPRLRKQQVLSIPLSVLSVILSLVGIFIMRFAFYMMHMTSGLSI